MLKAMSDPHGICPVEEPKAETDFVALDDPYEQWSPEGAIPVRTQQLRGKKRIFPEAATIEISDTESEIPIPAKARFRARRQFLHTSLARELHISAKWPLVAWRDFEGGMTFRDMGHVVLFYEKYCKPRKWKVGITTSPLWRMFGALSHKNGMRPHIKDYNVMIVMTVRNPAFCAAAERWLIQKLRHRPRCMNVADGGEGAAKNQLVATYVYMVLDTDSPGVKCEPRVS